jgi:NAD(P)H-hydrate repair Nnr-like enzyme with NAD(P)H-hydrate epimerase domain
VDTFLKRKKKTEDDQQRERFIKIIQTLEEIEVRGMILGNDLALDFSSYDEKFYFVIDALFSIAFSKEACELIFFYIYERLNPDGTEESEVVDLEGNNIPLSSPEDLCELVKLTQEKVGKAKKK